MNLIFIERMNSLTAKIIELRQEAEERRRRPPHPKHGARRHAFFVTTLENKAEYLEKQRLALLNTNRSFQPESLL